MNFCYLDAVCYECYDFACAAFLLLACSKCTKEYSYEGGGIVPGGNDTLDNIEPVVKSEWEFKESAVQYEGPVDTAYLTQEGNISVLTVTGKSKDGMEKISFTIRAPSKIEKGKIYTTSREEVKFIYAALDTIYSAIPYVEGDIYLSVTDVADNKVVGAFKGLVLKKDGRSYQVTDGKFSSPLKRVPASEAKGYIMLWAEENCNGPIKVKVNNRPGVITKFPYIKPNCGDDGSATFNDRPGVYEWVAYCGKDSVFGTAELKAGSCTKVLVSFPIKPATITTTEVAKTCKLSSITYAGKLFPIMPNAINTSFSGPEANALSYTVKVPGWAFNFTYAVQLQGNKILITHPTGDHTNYFITDARGRIVEYIGNTTPDTSNSASPEYTTYEYDNNNNLIKRTFYKDIDRRLINKTIFTWDNGNITKLKQTNLITGSVLEYHYEYFTDRLVKAMPFFYVQAQEILMYQSALNFGNSLKNLPKTMKIHFSPTNIYTYDFYGYIIDDNDYVQSMRLALAGGTSINFNFEYRCL